jgi:hypothetical protein
MNVNSFLKSIREGHDPSKAEEVELLDALHLAFVGNPNTYLHSFFSADCAKWVAAQINLDMSVDLWSLTQTIQDGRNKAIEDTTTRALAAETKVRELENDVKGWAHSHGAQDERIQELLAREERMDEEIDDLRTQLERARFCISELMNEAMESWAQGKDVTPGRIRDIINAWED